MNKTTWICIILWGVLVTAFGLGVSLPEDGEPAAVQVQDVMFLLAGGLVTCLIGAVGLACALGWVPGAPGWNEHHEGS